MNMIKIDDAPSIYKLFECSSLINTTTTTTNTTTNISNLSPISPPIPLTWQVAVPSTEPSDCDLDMNTIAKPQFFFNQKPLPPTINIIQNNMKCNEIKTISNTRVISILKQFGEFNHFETCVNNIINGYVRKCEINISKIIPMDINNMCFLFYYETQNKYIHLAYKIYKICKMKWENENKFTGQLFTEIINNNLCNKENSKDICNELLCIRLIELVSYKTSFSSLFIEPNNNMKLFNVSNDYTYGFAPNVLNAFKEYENID